MIHKIESIIVTLDHHMTRQNSNLNGSIFQAVWLLRSVDVGQVTLHHCCTVVIQPPTDPKHRISENQSVDFRPSRRFQPHAYMHLQQWRRTKGFFCRRLNQWNGLIIWCVCLTKISISRLSRCTNKKRNPSVAVLRWVCSAGQTLIWISAVILTQNPTPPIHDRSIHPTD